MNHIRDKLINIIKTNPIDGISTRIKHMPELFDAVSEVTDAPRLIEKIYCYANDLTSPPRCPCGSPVKFISITQGYREFCSSACNHARITATNRRIATMISQGGVGLANPASRKKASETNQDRYGVTNPFCLPKVREWRAKNNPMKDPEIVKKMRDNCTSEHGVDWHSKRADVMAAAKATMRTRYGVENGAQRHYGDSTLATLTDYDAMKNLFDTSTISDIARQLQVSETTVFKYLNMLGIRSPNEITPEIQIKQWLSDIGMDDFAKTRAVLPAKSELDLYSPTIKLAIEYCGLYWHSQRYKDRNYHLNKYRQCNDSGIQLVTIFEDEWLHRPQIVKDRLLHILGMNVSVLGARSLNINYTDRKTANDFFERYHISGHANASVYIAARDASDNIRAMMSFGKNRKIVKPKIDWQWEMVRFTTDGGHYPGVAAKLFNAFVTGHTPSSVLSYADLRWGQGQYLQHLGFERYDDTPPNYWYFSLRNADHQRYHRFAFNKRSLMKRYPDLATENCTEYGIAKSAGLERIWDCGNAKWIWRAK